MLLATHDITAALNGQRHSKDQGTHVGQHQVLDADSHHGGHADYFGGRFGDGATQQHQRQPLPQHSPGSVPLAAFEQLKGDALLDALEGALPLLPPALQRRFVVILHNLEGITPPPDPALLLQHSNQQQQSRQQQPQQSQQQQPLHRPDVFDRSLGGPGGVNSCPSATLAIDVIDSDGDDDDDDDDWADSKDAVNCCDDDGRRELDYKEGAVPVRPNKRRKYCARGVSVHLSWEQLQPFFGLKQEEAAAALGISSSTLRKICRRLGTPRWSRFNSTTLIGDCGHPPLPQPPPLPSLPPLLPLVQFAVAGQLAV